ncbi:MAG: CrcB family protein [Acidimicrobiales bacterium]
MMVLAFGLLAVAGAVGRWQMTRLNSTGWPVGTLAVNVGAAFVLGLLANSSSSTITLAGVGLLGSYSTFSTVVREVTDLSELEGRRWGARYLVVTLVLGVAAALIGLELATQ